MNDDGLVFSLTDGCFDRPVKYHGDPAAVAHLRAGDFVIVEGDTGMDGEFWSGKLFAGDEAERLRQEIRPDEVGVPHWVCLHEQPARNAH